MIAANLNSVLAFARAHGHVVLAVVIVCGAGAWLLDHDAQVRQAQALADQKASFAVETKKLAAQAQQAIDSAAAQQAHIQDLMKSAAQLTQQVVALQAESAKRVADIATTPAGYVRGDVLAALGPGSEASGTTPPALALSEQGMRAADVAIAQRDGCEQQLAKQSSLVATLNQEAGSQKIQIGNYQDALAARDQMLTGAKQQAEAQLKAANGTKLQRAARSAKWFAVGAAAGIVVGVLK